MSDVRRIEVEEAAPGVRVIAFNRPEVRNAFDTAMYLQVTDALTQADADETVNAVVVTGRGGASPRVRTWPRWPPSPPGQRWKAPARDLPGCSSASMACPCRCWLPSTAWPWAWASPSWPTATWSWWTLTHASACPSPSWGCPEAASSLLFPAAMGHQRAARVLLTSDWVDAEELVRLGLALHVCAPGTVLEETVALAARIAAFPRGATRASVSLMRAARQDAVAQANRREQAAFATLLGGAASHGALADFAERSTPDS